MQYKYVYCIVDKITVFLAVTSTMAGNAKISDSRKRKENWGQDEIHLLVQSYGVEKDILRGDFASPGVSAKAKRDAWLRMADRLAGEYPTGQRSVKDCQKKWQLILSISRRNISKFKNATAATGKKVLYICLSNDNRVVTHLYRSSWIGRIV